MIAKKYILMLVFLVVPGVSGCDFVYRLIDRQGAEEKELVGEATIYEENPAVEEIQQLLKIYGYNSGKIDGILGPRTREAIAKFQRENGLDESRFADQATWEKLKVFKDNEFVLDGELNVRLVQASLISAGFDPGKIDGKFGSKTQEAVKLFQEAHQIKIDGKVGYQTLLNLNNYTAGVDNTSN